MKKQLLFAIAVGLTTLMTAQDNDGMNGADGVDGADGNSTYQGDFLDLFDKSRKNKEMVCTTTDGIFAIGWNQALGNGNGIGDNYRVWGSGSWELGLQFSTRLTATSDVVRLNYGLAMRWQSLSIRGDRQFETNGNVTRLEPVGIEVDHTRFNQFTLIAPVHLEFGKGELKEYANGIKRYDRDDSWIIGVGGYIGTNAGTWQTVKFEREGRNVTNTLSNDFEMEPLVYGLSAYVGKGHFQIFGTYGLNDVFKDSPVQEQMVSVGFRFQ
jgi:hypothetical protein